MSALAMAAKALILSCGLTATPTGEKVPDGMVPTINAPIPQNLAEALASGASPPAGLRFADSTDAWPEWIIGVLSDPTRGRLVSRLAPDIMGYKVRFGWAGDTADANGITSFEETSSGTCTIKDAAVSEQKTPQ